MRRNQLTPKALFKTVKKMIPDVDYFTTGEGDTWQFCGVESELDGIAAVSVCDPEGEQDDPTANRMILVRAKDKFAVRSLDEVRALAR